MTPCWGHFFVRIKSVPISVMVVMTVPHCDRNPTVMAAAMITNADADSPCPDDDSRSVRGRHRHRQSQPENCERSE